MCKEQSKVLVPSHSNVQTGKLHDNPLSHKTVVTHLPKIASVVKSIDSPAQENQDKSKACLEESCCRKASVLNLKAHAATEHKSRYHCLPEQIAAMPFAECDMLSSTARCRNQAHFCLVGVGHGCLLTSKPKAA